MITAGEVQAKVAAAVGELPEPLIDLERPRDDLRLTLEQSLDLVDERYRDAIRLLGEL